MFLSHRPLLSVTVRWLGALVAVFAIAACSHSPDAQMIEAAESLVPPESQILEVSDNSQGLTIEVGHYWAAVRFSDGGLGPALLPAMAERATAEGWQENFRCERLGGVELHYVRDEYRVNVSVLTKKEPVTGFISIERLAEANPYPSDWCR